jgi:hypothetical protein
MLNLFNQIDCNETNLKKTCNTTAKDENNILDIKCQVCDFERLYIISSDSDNDEIEGKEREYVSSSDEEEYVEIDVIEVVNIRIPVPKPPNLLAFEQFWTSTNPRLNTSNGHMYGEPTGGTLYKIWTLINQVYQPSEENDVLLDWGMGAGKMILSKTYLSNVPNMHAIGIEQDKHTCSIAHRNISNSTITNTRIFHGDSSTLSIQKWEELRCSIVVQYDGGPSPYYEEYHRRLMQSLFGTTTVNVVFSTKMNQALFRTYFEDTPHMLQRWTLYQMERLSFGGSHFRGNLWVRKDI